MPAHKRGRGLSPQVRAQVRSRPISAIALEHNICSSSKRNMEAWGRAAVPFGRAFRVFGAAGAEDATPLAGGALLRRVHPESRTVGSEDEGGAALLVVFEKCAANRLHHEFLIFTSVHQRCRRFVPALLYRQLECPRLEKRETWGTPQLFLCQLSKSRTLYARKCRPPATPQLFLCQLSKSRTLYARKCRPPAVQDGEGAF
jgi:hypothetical protein